MTESTTPIQYQGKSSGHWSRRLRQITSCENVHRRVQMLRDRLAWRGCSFLSALRRANVLLCGADKNPLKKLPSLAET